MKKIFFWTFINLNIFILTTACQKTAGNTWENVKTAGRYVNKGIDSLMGKNHDSKMIYDDEMFSQAWNDDFIPLSDKDLSTQYVATDKATPQPKYSPGEKGSGIPEMNRFSSPTAHLNTIFKTIHFETDDHVIREQTDLVTISKIASFLKKNPNYYIVIEGHTDERAAAAYNMALGTRRANHIRVLLIKQGVDFNRIYTISYGKEKPVSLGHAKDDWSKNRRSQFKIFNKTK
jgi:peptidoglycan-associated lipoprotein